MLLFANRLFSAKFFFHLQTLHEVRNTTRVLTSQELKGRHPPRNCRTARPDLRARCVVGHIPSSLISHSAGTRFLRSHHTGTLRKPGSQLEIRERLESAVRNNISFGTKYQGDTNLPALLELWSVMEQSRLERRDSGLAFRL